MKTYTFPVGGSFGKGDSWDGIFDFALTDEEAARLEASARKEPHEWMDEDPEISDIMEKVIAAARENDIQNMMDDKDLVREQREWYEDDHEAGASDRTVIEWYMDGTSYNAMYPEELQLLGGEEDE